MNLDSTKIKELGDTIANYKNVLDSSLDSSYYENNSNYHSIAEYYDTLSYILIYILNYKKTNKKAK